MPHPAWVLLCTRLRTSTLQLFKAPILVQGSGVDVFVVQPGMSQTDFFPKMVG